MPAVISIIQILSSDEKVPRKNAIGLHCTGATITIKVYNARGEVEKVVIADRITSDSLQTAAENNNIQQLRDILCSFKTRSGIASMPAFTFPEDSEQIAILKSSPIVPCSKTCLTHSQPTQRQPEQKEHEPVTAVDGVQLPNEMGLYSGTLLGGLPYSGSSVLTCTYRFMLATKTYTFVNGKCTNTTIELTKPLKEGERSFVSGVIEGTKIIEGRFNNFFYYEGCTTGLLREGKFTGTVLKDEKLFNYSNGVPKGEPIPFFPGEAKKIQRLFRTHLGIRMQQYSNDLRKLLNCVGEKVSNFQSIQVNDVIVIANAQLGFHVDDWQKHGYILIVNNLQPFSGTIFELTTSDRLPDGSSVIGEVSGYNFKGKFLISTQTMDAEYIQKLSYLCTKGTVFKVKIDIHTIKAAFILVYMSLTLASKKMPHYSDQTNNCNHIVYRTIKAACQIINEQKSQSGCPESPYFETPAP